MTPNVWFVIYVTLLFTSHTALAVFAIVQAVRKVGDGGWLLLIPLLIATLVGGITFGFQFDPPQYKHKTTTEATQ